jgi:hypothetical protein
MLILNLVVIASACFKMSYSFKGASISPELKTVSIQFVDNKARTIEPGLDQRFTEELKDYFESNTNLFLVNGIGHADFDVEITSYDYTRPVSIGANDVAAQNRFTIGIKAAYTNSIDPEQDYESTFSRFRDYSSSGNFEDYKEELTAEILKELIEDIFNKAFVNW